MLPIDSITRETAKKISYVLMDIDDTITLDGKLPAEAYSALWQLHDAGFHVIPITGRPAGWCDLIARQWPVTAVVGENGALVFWEDGGKVERLYHENAVPNDHETLQKIQNRILQEIPGSHMASDQFARMFDLAFDFHEEKPILSLDDALAMQQIAEQEGAVAKISSIHVNVWMGRYTKLSMAKTFLQQHFAYDDACQRDTVIFFGDSPNDEPMFSHFPQSVGVANIAEYRHLMEHLPTYITHGEGGYGFAEGVRILVGLKNTGHKS